MEKSGIQKRTKHRTNACLHTSQQLRKQEIAAETLI